MIEQDVFGATRDGKPVTRFVLTNRHGFRVGVMGWGATLLQVAVPDRDQQIANVNLCFDSIESYLDGHPYFGATVGRFCNRIEAGKFSIDGTEHQVTVNSGKHHLHGGNRNFSYQLWEAECFDDNDGDRVRFRLTSPDGDEGFPGTLNVVAEYAWNDQCELTLRYEATTDAATHVNLCNHSYWNLGGVTSGKILSEVAQIDADQWLDVDDDLIPTGKLNDVAGTPLDFRQPRMIGERIEQLASTGGYDHCYVVRGESGTLRRAAQVFDPTSGRTLQVETTQPGMQLYTANHLPGDASSGGWGGHEAFCLETQHYPNSPNLAGFPPTLLRPGQPLSETTIYRFGVAS